MKRLGYIVMMLMSVSMTALADIGTIYDKADSLYNQQQYDEAQKLALEALSLCKDSTDVADCTSLLALIHVRKGEFGEAVRYAKRCNAIDVASGDPGVIYPESHRLCPEGKSSPASGCTSRYGLRGVSSPEAGKKSP